MHCLLCSNSLLVHYKRSVKASSRTNYSVSVVTKKYTGQQSATCNFILLPFRLCIILHFTLSLSVTFSLLPWSKFTFGHSLQLSLYSRGHRIHIQLCLFAFNEQINFPHSQMGKTEEEQVSLKEYTQCPSTRAKCIGN